MRVAGALPSAIAPTRRGTTRQAAPNGADVAFAKAFAIGDFGKCRNATNPDIFNQSPRLGDGGKQRSGSIVGFVVGSCTMPFTAMKVGTAQGSVTAVVASSPGGCDIAGELARMICAAVKTLLIQAIVQNGNRQQLGEKRDDANGVDPRRPVQSNAPDRASACVNGFQARQSIGCRRLGKGSRALSIMKGAAPAHYARYRFASSGHAFLHSFAPFRLGPRPCR